MKNLNKKKIIIVGICIIALIIIIAMVLGHKGTKNDSNSEEHSESERTLYTHQVIDIENLDTSLYKDIMKTTKDFKIASKYNVGKEAITINAKVDMYIEGQIARAFYIRDDDTKLNIVQLKYQLTDDENTPKIMQVEEMMRDFEMECKSNMGLIDLEKEPNEVSISNEKISYSESIYDKKELYSAKYVVEDEHFTEEEIKEMGIDMSEYNKTFEINFYMDGDDTLVCEFVRIL